MILIKLKKIWKFLSSMKFAILLLLLLAGACVVGSLIPQGKSLDWYRQNYAERTAALIYGTHFDDVFHCAWFLVLTTVLCGNLLLCNLLRLPQLLQRWRNAADPDRAVNRKPSVTVSGVSDPEELMRRLRMPKPSRTDTEAGVRLFAVKHRVGLWGAWVCHLGILLLIIGVVLGQRTKVEYTVYGVPGQTKPVGDTGYTLTIDEFEAEYTESGTPSQFTSRVTMRSPEGEARSAQAQVNGPGSLFGYKIFQNSTGTAAKLTVLFAGEPVQEEYLCPGDYLEIRDTPVAVLFDGYNEAGVFDDGSTHPVYDYALYDMSRDLLSADRYQLEGEAAVKTEAFELRFSDPQAYTLLQIKRDDWTWLVLAGGLITLLGLILAFYLQPRQLLAEREPEGGWTLRGWSRKGGALFAEQVKREAQSAE